MRSQIHKDNVTPRRQQTRGASMAPPVARRRTVDIQNLSAVAQRVVIHSADADEYTEYAQLGFSRLISASEIQNTNTFLKNEDRQGLGVFSIEDIDQPINYDDVNYVNGHYNGGAYLAKTPAEMAKFFQDTGLKSGQKLVLLGCESAAFAQQLAVLLHAKGITTTVTGAQGIAFDYKTAGQQGAVVEAMYDKQHAPLDEGLKHDIATKYEERFINELVNSIIDQGSEEEMEAFAYAFTRISGANLTHVARSTLTPVQEPKVIAAAALFQGRIGAAPNIPAALQVPMTVDALIQLSEQAPLPAYGKADLIALKNQATSFLPRRSERASDLRGLKNQALTGVFKLRGYTSKDQLWIRDFMRAVNGLQGEAGEAVKAIVLHKYIELGRVAANEYVSRMAATNDQIPQAIIQQGWQTFDHTGNQTQTHRTYREAADAEG